MPSRPKELFKEVCEPRSHTPPSLESEGSTDRISEVGFTDPSSSQNP